MAGAARCLGFLVFLLVIFIAVSSPSFSSSSSSGVLASASAPTVSLALYYESLCPYCSKFIVKYLPKILHDGLISIVDLELVPYGNALVGSNSTISCQHGPDECYLNTVEACAIHAWPELETHFSFIYCVEDLVSEHRNWESCYSKLGLDSQPVSDCIESGYGNKLELQYAKKTDSLEPPHKYVPWVVVDGTPLFEDYMNFESYICKAYTGEPPKACLNLLLKNSRKIKARDLVFAVNTTNPFAAVTYSEKKIQMVV